MMVSKLCLGGFDTMNTKEKLVNQIEKQILDAFEEEMKELNKQGKLHKFETAMDNAVEKFNIALKEKTEAILNKDSKESGKKKLHPMWTTNKNSKL